MQVGKGIRLEVKEKGKEGKKYGWEGRE